MLVIQSKKKIIIQKLVKLKRNLLIIIMINTLRQKFNKFTAGIFDARLARANLVTKTDFDNKLISLNKKN